MDIDVPVRNFGKVGMEALGAAIAHANELVGKGGTGGCVVVSVES